MTDRHALLARLEAGDADARADLIALAARLDAQVTEWELWRDNPTQASDDTAERFYRATGLMAPYKSQPLEMSSVSGDAERQQRYDEWMQDQKAERYAMLRSVAEVMRSISLRAMPTPPDAPVWSLAQLHAQVDAALTDMPPYWQDENLHEWLYEFAKRLTGMGSSLPAAPVAPSLGDA